MILIAAAAVAVGCGPQKTNAELITSTAWHLDEIIYDGRDATETPPANVTIIFSDSTDRIAGRGGCNNFFGVYKLKEKENIEINMGGSTMMACPDMEFEGRYFKLLDQVESYSVSETELKLFITAEGTTLMYKPEFKAYEE